MELTILTMEEPVFSGEVDNFQLPGALGLMGVLNNHAPIVSKIDPGLIKIKTQENIKSFFISGGFFECFSNKAVVLADACESPESIDKTRAKKAAQRAKARLSNPKNIDILRAQRALSRAFFRLKACQ